MVLKISVDPTDTVSPLETVVATDSGLPTTRPRYSTSSSCSWLIDGAAPNSTDPGNTKMMFEPEPLDLCLDLLLGAAADGDEHDDGPDTDDDAEHREQAAQPVRPQRIQGDAERLSQPHVVTA